jgi:hypothetical protein
LLEKRLFISVINELFEKHYVMDAKVEILPSEDNTENAVKDLEYFRNEMIRLHEENELSADEIVDLMDL